MKKNKIGNLSMEEIKTLSDIIRIALNQFEMDKMLKGSDDGKFKRMDRNKREYIDRRR